MQAFSNQTGKHHFDAHGREIPPGRIIGVERPTPAAEPQPLTPETDADPASSQPEATTEKPAEAKQRKPGG